MVLLNRPQEFCETSNAWLLKSCPYLVPYCRILQDYVVFHFGSAVFKIFRLLAVAMLCVHCFACAFYRVKKSSAYSPADVDSFYESRGTNTTVSGIKMPLFASCVACETEKNFDQDLSGAYVSFHPHMHSDAVEFSRI